MKKAMKPLIALCMAIAVLTLIPATALAKLSVDNVYIEAIVIKNNTPLKNENGKTLQKLNSGDEIGVEAIDGETYWIEYGGAFLKIAASNASLNYPENLYGEVLRKTYALDPRSGKRMFAFSKLDELSVAGREGKYLICELEDGFVRVLAKDVFMDGSLGSDFS